MICASADVLPADHKREIIYNVVSDGACAVLVERDGVRNRILAHRRVAKGYYWNAGARKNDIVAAYFPTSRTIVRDTLSACGLSADDIALIVPHNVSLRSWQILLPLLGMSSDRLFADIAWLMSDSAMRVSFLRPAGRLEAGGGETPAGRSVIKRPSRRASYASKRFQASGAEGGSGHACLGSVVCSGWMRR